MDIGTGAASVSIADHVAYVEIGRGDPGHDTPEDRTDIHWSLGAILERLRWDDDVHVIVLTGHDNGFLAPIPTELRTDSHNAAHQRFNERHFSDADGPGRAIRSLVSMTKPVVAKVGGDAIGYGSSVAFAADFVVAATSARFSDVHTTMGTIQDENGRTLGPAEALPPGDGAIASLPLAMPLPRLREYLFLGAVFTGSELAAMGAIHAAVEADELDGVVDELVQQLLRRGHRVLGMTKTLVNRRIEQIVHDGLDLSLAYQQLVQNERA